MSDALLFLAGLAALLIGGEVLVRGAVATARRLDVSPLLIGLTVVSFGTSAPELFTSVDAVLADAPGMVVGNVIGSNIANILLILGLAAVLAPRRHALPTSAMTLKRDLPVLVATSLALLIALQAGVIGRGVGLCLVAALGVYLLVSWWHERGAVTGGEIEAGAHLGLVAALGLFAGGLGLIVVGAHALVTAAIAGAREFGVSETVIGLTVVAIGTSLPELVTSAMAALRGRADLAFGNVVGSNIFNILAILGITTLVRPIAVPAEVLRLDIWVMLAATAAMVVMAATGRRVTRGEGAVLLAAYGAYIAWLAATA